MPPILFPSSDKRIATQILVTAKLNEKEDFILRGFVCDITICPKLETEGTRIKCENCSRLRMKTLERCQWRRSSVYIVNCKHISNFLLIIDFEQANIFWVHIEDKIRYIMRCVAVIYV